MTIETALHDTAMVGGVVPGFDIGAVSFTLDGNGIASATNASATAYRSQAVSAMLGSHNFAASVAGNDDYIGSQQGRAVHWR